MGKTHLAPGFRFHPTDVELVKYYLKRKVMGKKLLFDAIAEVDIYKFAPSDLSDKSYLRTGDLKWYFFCPREKKYASGARLNRATESGYWKTTGKDRPVLYNNEVVGMIKTLVFHHGKAPRGERTDWVMHEYRLEDKDLAKRNVVQDAYVLCVVFKKDGPGPRNGAQYGAPFREEDWSDDDEDVAAIPLVDRPVNLPAPNKVISSVATRSHVPVDLCAGVISHSCVSDATPADKMLPSVFDAKNNTAMSMEVPQAPCDDISSMLDFFLDDESFFLGDRDQIEMRDEANIGGFIEDSLHLERNDIFSGLADLSNVDVPSTTVSDFPSAYNLNEMVPTENTTFLELHDLQIPMNFPAQDNLENNCLFPEHNYGDNSPGQLGFPVDPPCSVAGKQAIESTQSQLQPTEPYSNYSNAFERSSF